MGYGEFGGGGSVKWEIDVNDGSLPSINEKPGGNPRKYKVNSLDTEGTTSKSFLVTLENPTHIKVNGTTLTLKVPIEKDKKQVKVEWPYAETDQELKDMKPFNMPSLLV